MTITDTDVERLTRLNAQLLAALIALDAAVDSGEIYAFAPASQVVDGGPTLRQLSKFRALAKLVRSAIAAGREQL